LNSAPLVWGLLHGPQKGIFDLTFRVPSELAKLVSAGAVEIGNIPVIECARQRLEMVRGVGVACRGAVRSILLISKRPLDQIQTLASDSSSRSSVALARIVLARRYGVQPEFVPYAPDLSTMLATSDAALMIGDPALRLDIGSLPYHVIDLGQEWFDMTGLPMVFAVWAGKQDYVTPELTQALIDSYHFGRDNLEDVIRMESAARGIPEEVARPYLTSHIVNELGPREYEGMDLYLNYARDTGVLAAV
jgi:chorismate dehydratase